MYVVEPAIERCPKCGTKMWRLINHSINSDLHPQFLICDDDFSHCGYIEQVNFGPVERTPMQ